MAFAYNQLVAIKHYGTNYMINKPTGVKHTTNVTDWPPAPRGLPPLDKGLFSNAMEDNAGPVTECGRSTGACARSKPPAGSDSQPPRRERSARPYIRVPIPSRTLNNQWSSLHIIYSPCVLFTIPHNHVHLDVMRNARRTWTNHRFTPRTFLVRIFMYFSGFLFASR